MPNTKEMMVDLEKQLGGFAKMLDALLEKVDAEGTDEDKDLAKRVRLSKSKKEEDDDESNDDSAEDDEDDDMDKRAAKKAAKVAKADADKVAKEAADKVEADKVAKAKKAKDDAENDDEDDDSWSKKGLKKGEEEETVTVGDQVIAKSAIGSAAFAIVKAQQDEIAANKTAIAKEVDLRETAQFQKRADELYEHVPGSVEERGEMLKAISKMDKKLQKSFESVFVASEKLSKNAFEMTGRNGNDDLKKTAAAFDTKVQEIKKRDECTLNEAMTKARVEDPDGFKAYQDSSN